MISNTTLLPHAVAPTALDIRICYPKLVAAPERIPRFRHSKPAQIP